MTRSNDVQSLMASSFPHCPICEEKGKFLIVNDKKHIVSCRNCEAEWRLILTPEKDEIFLLSLEKSDREKRTKSLRGLKKTLGFWQNCDVTEYSGKIEKERNYDRDSWQCTYPKN